MPSIATWDYLKEVLKKAKKEEMGVQLMSSGTVLADIKKVDEWKETYGNFVVHEDETKTMMFNAADIIFVEISDKTIMLHVKLGIIPSSAIVS